MSGSGEMRQSANTVDTSRPSRFQLWYGCDKPPVETRELRAGPVTALLDGPDLRFVRLDGIELARRVYVGVRDVNWGTVLPKLSEVEIDAGEDRFAVSFVSRHRQGEIDFEWRGEINGGPDGTITYAVDGAAHSAFGYAKIGICIHHPIRESAGHPYHAHTPDGHIEGRLPDLIGPQIVQDGIDMPLFDAFDDLTVEADEGVSVRFAFEGDLFEMEDQRNWTDASFKSYSTPAKLGQPFHAEPGQTIQQRITISSNGTPEHSLAVSEELTLSLGEPLGKTLPPIGLGMASHGGPLSIRQAELLRAGHFDHLRVDLHLAEAGWERELERGLTAAAGMCCGLELGVFITDAAESQLAQLADHLKLAASLLRRVLVFHEDEIATDARWLRVAREQLKDAVPGLVLVGGSNVYFNELNRVRPSMEDADAVTYSVNPQIHAFDETSLIETFEGQAETVRTARSLYGDVPLIVSPVTFKPRFNAVATEPEPEPEPGELPDQVDPRQMSLFGAGWTLGSVKTLAESNVASLTLFETTGWRGLMDTEAGSQAPERFPSLPGGVLPLYHILADLGEAREDELLECSSSDPLSTVGLAFRSADHLLLLIASLTPGVQQVTIGPLEGSRALLRRLNDESALQAMLDPERFRSAFEPHTVTGDSLIVELAPYETLSVEVTDG